MDPPISIRTFQRLVELYQYIDHAPVDQTSFSSSDLAQQVGVSDILVRKDLNRIGLTGRPKRGFDRGELVHSLGQVLGYSNPSDAVLVGCGRLGRSLLDYHLLDNLGISLVAGFDLTPSKLGHLEVLPMTKLTSLIQRLHVRLALLCVPEESAQVSADRLISAGIRFIWNFTPVTLQVPEGVCVYQEDLRQSAARILSALHQGEK